MPYPSDWEYGLHYPYEIACAICRAPFADCLSDPDDWEMHVFEWETRAYIIGENPFASTIEK